MSMTLQGQFGQQKKIQSFQKVKRVLLLDHFTI